MKSLSLLAVVLVAVSQVSAIAIRPMRPAAIGARPMIRPAGEEPAVMPCVTVDESQIDLEEIQEPIEVQDESGHNVGTIIKPQPNNNGGGASVMLPINRPKPQLKPSFEEEYVVVEAGGGQQVLLPVGRPLRPSDLLKPVEHKPAVESLVKPAPVDLGSLTRPMPVQEQEFVLPNDRPLTPADLLRPQPQKPSTGSLVKPAPIDVGQLIRPNPVESGSSGVVLLPNDRPLKPSDLLKPNQPQEEGSFGGSGSSVVSKPSVRPVPINQGNGFEQQVIIRPRPVEQQAEEQEKPSVRPVPINQGNGFEQQVIIRPQPAAQEKPQEEEASRPGMVLLPSDRPLRPSDLLVQKPSVRPVPINQGNGFEQQVIIRPQPVEQQPQEEEASRPGMVLLPSDRPLRPSDLLVQKPAVRPVPINQGNGFEQQVIIRPRPVVVEQPAEEQVAEEPSFVLLPNDRPLRPSDLLVQKPSVRPVPINQGNGFEQQIIIRPQPVAQQVEEEVVAEEPSFLWLPNDRPLRPSDLLQAAQQQARPVRPVNDIIF